MFRRYRFAILVLISVLSLVLAPMAFGEDVRPDGRPGGTETPKAPAAGPSAVGLEFGSDRDVQLEGTLDQVILDDLIVDGSACVGFDCVNGESFGFDTLRLKENNLRIKFLDTSSTASFPSNDWQLTANDSSNGGANKFSIDDITGGRTPFTIEAGAPSHSLFVDDGGRLGLGTSTPVADVHVKSGNTPTLRLEQDGSSGFTPQTWDVAGNEANFFIRDATNGSTLPFRLRPGAPSSSIDIAASGNVGIGTANPAYPLTVDGVDGGPTIAVDGGQFISVINNDVVWFRLRDDGATAQIWDILNDADDRLVIVDQSGGGGHVFEIEPGTGNVFVGGTMVHSSDANAKRDVEFVDIQAVLDLVAGLDITEWSYESDPDARHLGPMAQDFAAAFGLGSTNTGIATVDADGIALVAIQALAAENQDLMERVAALESLVEQLLAALAL